MLRPMVMVGSSLSRDGEGADQKARPLLRVCKRLPPVGRLRLAVSPAAAGRPVESGWPGPRRGEIRFAPFPPDGENCAPLLCPSFSPPNPLRWASAGTPPCCPRRWISYAAVKWLSPAAAGRPEESDWPGPAWPGRTAPGCCSWCRPSFPRRCRCRGWWTRRPGCSPS